MASQLPPFPRLVFTVLEPISLLAGWLPAAFLPAWFMGEQLPGALRMEHTTAHSLVVTRQLGNCYLLAFLVAIAVLYSTSEIKVVRNYLVALWIADITHVLTTALALGYEGTMQVRGWNATTWGNIGATVSSYLPAREVPEAASAGSSVWSRELTVSTQMFLFLTRSAYFAGLFGPNLPAPKDAKKQR